MGAFWVQDLDTVLLSGVGKGIPIIVPIQGWETRSRSSGGLDSINGTLKHHTASPESWDWARDVEYLAFTNPYAPSPVSQLYISRNGKVAIIAAGAANHGGAGGAYKPGGPTYVTVNRANQTLIGQEMGNNGIGEQWPWRQIEASITVDALICLAEKWGPGHVFAHKEYCGPGTTTPGRKIDPFGPWEDHPTNRWPKGSTWGGQQGNIDFYRDLVGKKMYELSQEINVMQGFVPRPPEIPPRIVDTRGPDPHRDAYKLNANQQATVNVPGGAGKSFAIVNITVTEGEGPGFITAWAGGSVPNESKINWGAHTTIANEVTVPLNHDGTFQLVSIARVHLIVDLVGYYQKM